MVCRSSAAIPSFSVFALVLLRTQQTETVWLHLRVHVCVFSLRRQDQIGHLTVPYLGRLDLHS